MQLDADLLEGLARRLPEGAVVAGIGDPAALAQLQQRVPWLIRIFDAPLQRQDRRRPPPRTLRAHAMALPIMPGKLDALVATEALSRSEEAASLLACWGQHLRPGGWLLIAEPLIRSATMRRLARLLGGPRFARPPEEITGLLLNAGFGEIGQVAAGSGRPAFVTSARLRDL